MATNPLAVLPKEGLLLLYFGVDVKVLFQLGKRYPWARPWRCPRCQGLRLWGHGYAARYFGEYLEPLWVKRYRCPDCEAVHTCRPDEYFERYRYPIVTVVMSLVNKILHGRWLRCINRQSQLPWYRTVWGWCSRRQAIAGLTAEHLRQYVSEKVSASKQSQLLRL